MKFLIILKIFILSLLPCSICQAQLFEQDNKLYKTISWNEFFKVLAQKPNTIFFDIRTLGERSDTSQYASYNQGWIKGAKPADFFDFEKWYPEYRQYKDSTIYFYCSHSRRSRLLSKRLSDSGFTKLVNINGGMTLLNALSDKEIPLKKAFYMTILPYKLIYPSLFIQKIRSKKTALLDIRADSAYQGIAINEWENSIGIIPNAEHISLKMLESQLSKLDKSKEWIIIDANGEESPKAAKILLNNGFSNVGVLFHGLDFFLNNTHSAKRFFLKSKYLVMTVEELYEQRLNTNVIVVDVRTVSEFANKDTLIWKNRGRIKNAINIPLSQFSKEALTQHQGKTIILYDLAMDENLYEAAKRLKSYGFEQFYLLGGGIFELHWQIANQNKLFLSSLLN
jgi:rhodanese-related sulfurtransferase